MASVLLSYVPERNAARLGPDHRAERHGDKVLGWGEPAGRTLRRAHALANHGVAQREDAGHITDGATANAMTNVVCNTGENDLV